MLIPLITELARALSLHAVRQQVLANDLANAHTKGFVAQDVDGSSFADVLGQSMALRQNDPRDLSAGSDASSPPVGTLISSPVLAGGGGTGVDSDAAMAEIAANALSYEAIATAAAGEVMLVRAGLLG